MEAEFAFLADAAESHDGKISVLGGAFDTIWSEKLPVIYPRLSFVMRLVFSPAEMGRRHNVEINIINADGKRLATVGGELPLGQKSSDVPQGWRQGAVFIMNFANLQFNDFGNYSFEIVINNTSIKSVPFRIAQKIPITPG